MSSPNKDQQFANLYAKKLKEMAEHMAKLAVKENIKKSWGNHIELPK